ncbi:MAG: tRNA pseudouridine(65) synthase TruC [Acidobacteria bacterium]|nr:tRNA pseudouridine(65) synthase TruC [Acidobacteriota bacterium]
MIHIYHRDDDLLIVHKPAGLLVHRTSISSDTQAMIQSLRDQIGQRVYPIHRLDRATSGLMLFGLNKPFHVAMQKLFETRAVHKQYQAVVRGFVDEGLIDYPLFDERSGRPLPALTGYGAKLKFELPEPSSIHDTSRYTWVEVRPETGRHHQIRRHFAHVRHPIVGDTVHGDGWHNRFFRRRFQAHFLFLAATGIHFLDPRTAQPFQLAVGVNEQFQAVLDALKPYAVSSSTT